MDMHSNDGGTYVWMGDGDGMSWLGILVMLALAIAVYLWIGHRDQVFCTEVCEQYGAVPVCKSGNCYCRDSQGIFDPSYAVREP